LARVRLARSAWRDLKLIRHSIAADSPKRAAAMIGRILDRCVLLGATPAHGRIREDLDVSFELDRSQITRMSFSIASPAVSSKSCV
jgi:plasmid stabilization system protein ParE